MFDISNYNYNLYFLSQMYQEKKKNTTTKVFSTTCSLTWSFQICSLVQHYLGFHLAQKNKWHIVRVLDKRPQRNVIRMQQCEWLVNGQKILESSSKYLSYSHSKQLNISPAYTQSPYERLLKCTELRPQQMCDPGVGFNQNADNTDNLTAKPER